MNKPASKQIEVQIMGQSYLLACPAGGEQSLLDAVERVDTAMCRIRDAGKVKAQVQYVTTGADDAADEPATRKTYETTRRNAADGWYFYPQAQGIPHPMVAKQEDHGKGHTPALYDMTLKFLDGGQPVDR